MCGPVVFPRCRVAYEFSCRYRHRLSYIAHAAAGDSVTTYAVDFRRSAARQRLSVWPGAALRAIVLITAVTITATEGYTQEPPDLTSLSPEELATIPVHSASTASQYLNRL